MISVLKEKIELVEAGNMIPLLTDIFKDPLPPEKYDIIYTLLALHHVHDVEKSVGIFSSLLKQGGYLCIGDLIKEDGSFHHKDPDFDGHKGFDRDVFKGWLENNGFTVMTNKIFSVIEKEHNSVMKKYPMFLLIGKKN